MVRITVTDRKGRGFVVRYTASIRCSSFDYVCGFGCADNRADAVRKAVNEFRTRLLGRAIARRKGK
jgi:hypothetical protein